MTGGVAGVALALAGERPPPASLLEPVHDRFDAVPAGLIDVVAALAVIVVAWLLGRGVLRYAGRAVARRFERPSVTRAILQVIRAGILAVGLIIAAMIVGVDPGDILLSVTVLSAVLAVVLAPVVRRFVGGMFVLADQPYELGDMIEIVDTGTRGFVEDVTLRYTKMFTLQNTFIVIPNSEILGRDIVNYSAEDERTRQELEVVVTYEGDLDEARRAIEAAAAEVEGVIASGPAIRVGSTRYRAEPTTYITEFGDHGVLLTLRYWVRSPFHLHSARSDVHAAIWDAIEDLPVSIAYPHQHVVYDETSGELGVSISRDDGAE